MIMQSTLKRHWQDYHQHAASAGFQQPVHLQQQAVAGTTQGKTCTQNCKLEERNAKSQLQSRTAKQALHTFSKHWQLALRFAPDSSVVIIKLQSFKELKLRRKGKDSGTILVT